MQIHQILPSLRPADAIGNEVRLIQNILQEWGFKSYIFAEHWDPDTPALNYKDYIKYSSKDNILIYHYAIGSEITEYIKKMPDRKILIYHNLTPAEFFRGINSPLYQVLVEGRNSLPSLAPFVDIAIGDSEYNRQELVTIGFSNTSVLPILIDFSAYHRFNPAILEKYSDEWVNILFVGRIAPNKKHEDILKTFYYYKSINPKSRLFLIGGFSGCERYVDHLRNIVKKLQLSDVFFTGSVPFEDLMSYYKIANVFLCMSEHEGFCVPLVESMFFGIPIIAYNSTAMPFTLGKSGIVIKEKKYEEIAELIDIIENDNELRKKIIVREKKRLETFEFNRVKETLRKILDEVLSHERSKP